MNHLEVKTKRSFLYASFLLIFAKREILFNVATFDVSLFSGGGWGWSLSFQVVAEFRGVASLEGSLLWRVSTFNGSLLSELYGILYAIKGMLHLARFTRCLRNSLRFSTQIRLLSVDFSFTYGEVTNSRNFLVYRTLATKMTQEPNQPD